MKRLMPSIRFGIWKGVYCGSDGWSAGRQHVRMKGWKIFSRPLDMGNVLTHFTDFPLYL